MDLESSANSVSSFFDKMLDPSISSTKQDYRVELVIKYEGRERENEKGGGRE